jgi:hypothetical protein
MKRQRVVYLPLKWLKSILEQVIAGFSNLVLFSTRLPCMVSFLTADMAAIVLLVINCGKHIYRKKIQMASPK